MGKFIDSKNLEKEGEKSTEMLRHKRAKLFKAFDIYKTNVSYKLLSETKNRHGEIVEWYQKALDLDEEAILNYPEELNQYL